MKLMTLIIKFIIIISIIFGFNVSFAIENKEIKSKHVKNQLEVYKKLMEEEESKKNFIKAGILNANINVASGKDIFSDNKIIKYHHGIAKKYNLSLKNFTLSELKDKYNKYKKQLQNLRLYTKNQLNNQNITIRKIYKNIDEKLDLIFHQMIKDVIKVLGNPPAKFTILSLGSKGNECPTPYSDLEYAIVVENNKELKYFKALSDIINLRIALLGETPILPMFFQKDLPNIKESDYLVKYGILPDYNNVFISTISGYIAKWKDTSLPQKTILLNAGFLYGNKDIYSDFNTKIIKLLKNKKKDFSTYTLWSDLKRYDPNRKIDNKMMNTKHNFYRIILSLIQNISLINDIKGNNYWEKLNLIKNNGFLNEKSYIRFSNTLNQVMTLRLKLQSNAEKQLHTTDKFKELENIINNVEWLKSTALKTIKSNWKNNYFNITLENKDSETFGDKLNSKYYSILSIASTAKPEKIDIETKKYKKLVNQFTKNKNLNIFYSSYYRLISEVSLKMKDYDLALLNINKAISIDLEHFGHLHPELINIYEIQARIYKSMGNQEKFHAIHDKIKIIKKYFYGEQSF